MNSPLFDLHPFAQALLGGVIIGFAAWLLLASIGRVAGISGVTATAVFGNSADRAWRVMFLVGLIGVGAVFANGLGNSALATSHSQPALMTIAAGLLVGFGTVIGSGCTSGHGVCGIGRRSVRSVVATLVFMATGIAATTLIRSVAH
jgi:uncharacterized protein